MRLIILLTILSVSLSSIAQKKNKKGVYDEYWKQQEQLEIFELKSKEAHKLFQEGKLKLALNTYEEALKINPKDQKTIAKIRDIKILLEKKERQNVSTKPADTTTVKKPIPIEPTSSIEKEDTTNLSSPIKEANNEPKPELDQIQAKPTKSSPPAIEKKKTKAVIQEEKEISKSTDKPYKNTENFRKYLATIYKEGWTEEKSEEGNKKILKRVHIYGDRGDEYQRITHHYGAIFYFKNGLSITYGTWVSETKDVE